MVHGFTSIGIVRKGEPMEVQNWPNLIDAPGLLMACKGFGAKSWSVDYDEDGMYKRAVIEVESVEIVYKGVGTQNMFALEHVQGVSLPGSYFDKKNYPLHEYINQHPLEPEPPVEEYSMLAEQLRQAMPGLMMPVPYPCDCKRSGDGAVWGIIQHLNDEHHPQAPGVADKWSRERIADWTEELPVDLTVDPSAAERRRAAWEHAKYQQELIKKWICEPVIVGQKFLDEITGAKKGKEEA